MVFVASKPVQVPTCEAIIYNVNGGMCLLSFVNFASAYNTPVLTGNAANQWYDRIN